MFCDDFKSTTTSVRYQEVSSVTWWGKLIGGSLGFVLGGPLGALIGASLGHNLDTRTAGLTGGTGFLPGDQERVQAAFFTATFSVMGAIAKADGQVSPQEIQLAESVMSQMNLTREMRVTAMNLFKQGKEKGFDLDSTLDQFRLECHRRQTLVQMFLEIQLGAAYADGSLNKEEQKLLYYICDRLGYPQAAFRRLDEILRAQMHHGKGGQNRGTQRGQPTLADAYTVLGVKAEVNDAELKRTYRRLMSQHHPDKLIAKGLPQEMIQIATKKTQEIQGAYETIKVARGMP